ncbi:MAG TPA: VWA domain-containing protein [Vicinamibacterales bacterium]|nr:VWA domain-containing protein [Vicinamibacterales bacterium]
MTRLPAGGIPALAAWLLLSAGASAQQPVFSSSTLGVRVDVLVTKGNIHVPGLTAADFELRDNGVLQTIDVIDSADVPVNAVLALDTSASTAGQRLADLTAASQTLLDGLKPRDRAALATFNHAVTTRVPLTDDLSTIGKTLEAVSPSGHTAIMDGVYVALMATQAESGRSLVVVCTDGRDTASWLQADEVLEAAKRSNAVIYAVAAGRARRWAALKDLTDATGGHTIDVESSRDLAGEFQKILQDFRSRYILTFVPAGVAAGGFHRLDIRMRRGGMTVKARPGYFGKGAGG